MKETPKTLLILRGLPGSGKTTLAHILSDDCVAADDYPLIHQKDGFHKEFVPEGHEWCKLQVKEMMESGKPLIVVHNTNVLQEHMQPYIALAKEYGYMYFVLHVQGRYPNVHGVDDAGIASMKTKWETYPE